MKIKDFENYINYINSKDLANVLNVNIDKYGYALYDLTESIVLQYSNQLPDNIFKYYTPKEGETPLLVAYNLYNDVRLYWIILKLNNISNSFYKFSSNDKIRYLDYTVIDTILRNM